MPGELLPRVLSSLRLRIEGGIPFKSDQTSLQVRLLVFLVQLNFEMEYFDFLSNERLKLE